MKNLINRVTNKRGNEIVEASISLPIILLTIFLLLRIFTWYLSILTTGIKEHEKALKRWDEYKGETMERYENSNNIYMLSGGILKFDLKKEIITEAYFFNEDNIVRANTLLK